MKLLLILSLVFSSVSALACLPIPGFESRVKNELLLDVANEYGVDLSSDKFTVENQKYQTAWTYTDSGFQCHDTDIASGTFKLNTKTFGQLCFYTVEAKIVSKPEAANQPAKSTITKELISKDCLSKSQGN